jgi:ribosome-binding factor A
MANDKNLKPIQTESEAREKGHNGGVASGKARREKKAIREILSEILDSEIKDSPQFAKVATKMGIETDKSVKDIFTLICLMNSLKEGNIADLEKLSKLLGEDKRDENADVIAKLDAVLGKVDELAE